MIDDFGFTLQTEEEMRNEINGLDIDPECKRKLEEVTEVVYSFLDKLSVDEEKTHINWPTRVKDVTKVKERIENIVRG